MASRHDIIQIDFRANAGRANPAIESLRQAAKSSRDEIARLNKELADGKAAGKAKEDLDKLGKQLADEEKKLKSFTRSERELVKGVDALNRAIEAFNNGTLDKMSAAFQKTAQNAANLARSRINPDTAQGKKNIAELDAIILATQKNLVKSKEDFKQLVQTIASGGKVSVAELNMAKTSLKELGDLTARGTKEWKTYQSQLATVEAKVRSITVEEQRMAGQKTLGQAFRGDFAGADTETLEQAIAKLKEYQSVIADPERKGARHFNATETAIKKLSEQLGRTKNDIVSVEQALKVAERAGGRGFTGTAEQLQLAEQAIVKAANAAKKGSPEWRRYQEALTKVRVEMQNAGMTSERMRDILAKPANAKNLNELAAAIKRAKAELNIMAGTVGKNSDMYATLANQTKNAEIQLKSLQAQATGTASSFAKAWSRLKTYVGLYVSAAQALQKIAAAINDVLVLSDKMGEVRKTTGFTADEVGRLTTELKKLDTRTSVVELLNLSAAAGQLGLKSQQEIQGFTEAANQLIVALPEMGRESATTLMKIANATGDLEKNNNDVRETMERIGSTIIALRANSASSAPAITDFVSRVGAVGAQAGISIDQIAALGSTIDALGGRVEMSATALSRMIPAIRNNAFGVANAIGVTEKSLTDLFNSGRAMEAMVLIFQKMRESVKGFDTSSEEGMNAMADNVEALLGRNAAMGEVMKELNQQGARAGIVFGLLSQNVDELEKQLGTASDAYAKNTALAAEYANMNETTAAKWERLKNQFEEFFVGDQGQRMLGGLIDGLRKIVDLLTGNGGMSVAIRTVLTYWIALKVGMGELFLQRLPAYFATARVGIMSMATSVGTYLHGAWAMVKTQVVSTDIATKRMAVTWKGLALNRYIVGAWAMLKTHVVQTDMATKRAAVSWKAMNASMNANVILAVVAALGYLIYKLVEWKNRVSEVSKALAEADTEIFGTQRAVTYLFDSLKKAEKGLGDTSEAASKAEESHAALKKEVEELRKSTNLSVYATAELIMKEEKLEEAEKKLAEAKSEVVKQESERKRLIDEINSKYSTYIGYMLSEDTAARNVAEAHRQIVAALKEEIYQKKKLGLVESVTNKHSEKLDEYTAASWEEIKDLPREVQNIIMSEWQHFLDGIKYDEGQGFVLPNGKVMSSLSDNRQALTDEFQYAIQRATGWDMDKVNKVASDWWGTDAPGQPSWMDDTGFRHWTDESLRTLEEIARTGHLLDTQIGDAHEELMDATWASYQGNMNTLAEMQRNNREGNLSDTEINRAAQALVGMTTAITKNNEIRAEAEGGVFAKGDINLNITSERFLAGFSKENRSAIIAAAQSMQKTVGSGGKRGSGSGGNGSTNPYGNYNPVTSPYEDWNADALVARRKEMLERVRALAAGADVQAVLSEDAKFITDATRNNIKTTKEAIEWYNSERLKIQDALHEKHLTNTGDWMDPKKGGKKASKLVQDEMKYYLDELDAYYTERKATIQDAQNDEQISEAEARNRTLANEAEWQQRRAELQQLYSKKRKDVAQEEADAIYDILSDRTGDSIGYIKSDIANTIKFIEKVGAEKGKPAMDRIYGDIDLGMGRSFLRQRNAIGQHMKDITAIVNKENPYVGITEELRKNLGTMNALLTDIEKEEERTVEKEIERTMFILEQSTKGYALTWEELMREMAKRGWQAWADAIEGDTQTLERLMHQVYRVFEKVQDAIKKEASELKKQADIMWSNILLPGGDGKTTVKDAFEQAIGALGIEEGRVSRANSLIGAGQASERVADRLAIQQMKVQLAMQQYQYSLVRKIGREKIDSLHKEAQEAEALNDIEKARQLRMQAQNAEMALNLATRKEQSEELKQQEAIIAKTEESEARLYKELREWADLLTSSLQSVFEASNAGNAEYYNELAKLNLTGSGGPGAGTYVVIDDAGTSDATAHYEYLDERAALERQREIEQQNAVAEAWKKVMDDFNQKMNETITDQLNAMLQNASVEANTQAVIANTEAIYASMGKGKEGGMGVGADGIPNALRPPVEDKSDSVVGGSTTDTGMGNYAAPWQQPSGESTEQSWLSPMAPSEADSETYTAPWAAYAEASNSATNTVVGNNKKAEQSTKASFAAMTAAANMYGIAYQAMSNENLSTAQKVEMMIVQAAGQAMISMLTASLAADTAETASHAPSWISKTLKELGPIGGPVAVGVFTALIGGLMGLATSKITKGKAQIAQATGASTSSAGRLSTGMLTYAEGNVNEFTDPSTLTPGRQYNVDAADGRTYRARYMGSNPKTHLTNGPEFHLSGERGREMIIDAGTTRQITMNEAGIWHAIQTLSGGGRISATRRKGGMRAFADGNVAEFEEALDSDGIVSYGQGMSAEQTMALQASLDRNSEVLERALTEGFKGVFNVYGKDGLVDSYDRGKKTLNRYGEKY